jgi:hypothetical protein
MDNNKLDKNTEPRFTLRYVHPPFPAGIANINSHVRADGTFRLPRFNWSPNFANCPTEILYNQIIVMSGSREGDYDIADTAVGLPGIPVGRTWHHLYNFHIDVQTQNPICNMQLIYEDTHYNSIPHCGSCIQYYEYYNHGYNYDRVHKNIDKKITFSENLEIPKYTENQIVDFENSVLSRYNLKLAPFIRQAYITGKFTFPKKTRERFHHFIYLSEKDGLINSIKSDNVSHLMLSIEYILKGDQEKRIAYPSQTAVPFGLDPFGNIFYADQIDGKDVIWFYDHESDNPNNTWFII